VPLKQTLVSSREFRQLVLRVLVRLYESVGVEPHYLNMCQCLMFLDDADGVAAILTTLIQGGEEEHLLAYQIAFSLYENEIQAFLNRVNEKLAPAAPAAAPIPAPAAAGGPSGGGDGMDTEEKTEGEDAGAGAGVTEGEGDDKVAAAAVAPLTRLRSVLSGELPVNLHLEFLFSHNAADLVLLKQIRAAVESRNSVCHSATVLCNALMHAGTTVDTFLRENLDWLSRATNWARFSATAGMGVIHHGQLAEGRQLMGPFLPRDAGSGGGGMRPSPYTEGGALYALGLIHANHGAGITQFLLESARSSSNEVIQHGAALGLGLAALGTGDEEVYTDLFRILRTDGAVAGEGAGIGMGLLLAGTSPAAKQQQILAYCHKTAHEKIIRGCALGLALTAYGREEEAEPLVEQMVRDADPIIRYGGCLAVAAAHVATGNNAAIRRLLHIAVSDVSDDVRRAAVMSLGFVLCSTPAQCPRVVSLLAESYNPHVRYGAAMAVGICCAGTGLKEAVALLEPMLTDAVDFVQQGALIATAMVMVEQSEANLAPFRKRLGNHIMDEREVTMTKMGALMAQGIVDAGGRNVTIGLRARSGFPRMTAVVSMLVFTQYWYWSPLAYFVSLTFVPTAFIGLDAQLKMPHCSVTSHCKPSLFAYPPPATVDDKKDKGKAVKAVLSTTAKAKAKAARKDAAVKKDKGEAGSEGAGADATPAAMDEDRKEGEVAPGGGNEGMDVDGGDAAAKKGGASGAGAEGKGGDAAAAAAAPAPEPSTEELSNPARVTPAQERYVRFDEGSRFVPVAAETAGKAAPTRGFVVLRDTTPGEAVEYVTSTRAPAVGAAGGAGSAAAAAVVPVEAEPAPPAAFEFDPNEV
jgi:26S proteasome regulatory subunit N2